MGRGHAHSKMTSGCGGSHLRVCDIISRERRDKMACKHDIRESENSWEQTEVSDFSLSVFYFICGTIFTSHTLSVPMHLVIDDLPAHITPFKYHKMRLDSLSRTSCTHDLRPSGNVMHYVARNVIDVASLSEDKLRRVTNRASVARAATTMTLSTSRCDIVWPIYP
jgi:hypothetical protein